MAALRVTYASRTEVNGLTVGNTHLYSKTILCTMHYTQLKPHTKIPLSIESVDIDKVSVDNLYKH